MSDDERVSPSRFSSARAAFLLHYFLVFPLSCQAPSARFDRRASVASHAAAAAVRCFMLRPAPIVHICRYAPRVSVISLDPDRDIA